MKTTFALLLTVLALASIACGGEPDDGEQDVAAALQAGMDEAGSSQVTFAKGGSLSYECNEGVCFCDGVLDCLKLGQSGICKPDPTWCSGDTCVCWDKSRF